MTAERAVRIVAGVFVLLSLALGYWVTPWFFLFTAFVGVNLIQSAFTGFCPAERRTAYCLEKFLLHHVTSSSLTNLLTTWICSHATH